MDIISNDSIVRQCLEVIACTVMDNGGEIHPHLTVNHHAERLWLTCPAEFKDEILLRIPHALFVPVSNLSWSGDDGVLSFSGDTSTLSVPQRMILDAMITLYNATDKIPRVAARFPDSLFRQDPAMHEAILRIRPHTVLCEESLAEQFIRTRKSSQNNEDSEETNDYLMPLIDMLNHHPFGPKYGRNEAGDWVIPVQHPKKGSDECFVRYQKGDSLAIALLHGYFENAPDYLSSVQCTFTHAALRHIIVHGVNHQRRKLNAPLAKQTENGLALYNIVLAPDTLPALRTFLGLAVRSVNRQLGQKEAEHIANGLIETIISENRRYFLELRMFCAIQQGDFPLRMLFFQVAGHQLEVLDGLAQGS